MWHKPTTSYGLTRWMKQLANTFWIARHTSQMASPGHGLAHTDLVGDRAETAGCDQLHDCVGHSVIQSEGWPYADILVHDVEATYGQ